MDQGQVQGTEAACDESRPAGERSDGPDQHVLDKANKALAALAGRAEGGDETAMAELRATLKDAPRMWGAIDDTAAVAENAWLQVMAGDNLLFREGLERRLRKLKTELSGPGCSPLERLLVERIAACWLQVQYADAKYAQNMKDLSLPWGEYYQRRQDRTHRRLLSAIKALATVRKLALPVLQVNIGDKQVNVAGG